MSELSELYQVPAPDEVESLLRGDFTKDEAAPKDSPGRDRAAAQVGDRENPPGANSKVLEVRDRKDSKVMEVRDRKDSKVMEVRDRQKPSLSDQITELLPMDWETALEIMADQFFDTSISTAYAGEIHEFLDLCGVIEDIGEQREEAYRESVREIRRESNERIEKLSKLVTRLYLDLYHIEQIAGALMQVADRYSPDELKAIASLITHQSIESRNHISSHTETDHYPQAIIKINHERSTTNSVQTNASKA
ncbi:hypothetical protein ACL6C3_16815 [Capilliphycus salinus ALCB114379]|uniref:hypothetical protein n=1 Tax=Capilliphycus salinus TaxID=2768948 RepID=UPI0039A6ECB2